MGEPMDGVEHQRMLSHDMDFMMEDLHYAPSNVSGATLKKCILMEPSSIEVNVNGYELIQKHKLLFGTLINTNNGAPDDWETTGSIFQFPRNPSHKVYGVKATYRRGGQNRNVIKEIDGKIYSVKKAEWLYDHANEKKMTGARIELEDHGDKFQYFFGPCPHDCEYIEIEFVLGRTMQNAVSDKDDKEDRKTPESFEASLPLHIGLTKRDPNRMEEYRHRHQFIEDITIKMIHGTETNLKLSAAVDNHEVPVEFCPVDKSHNLPVCGERRVYSGGEYMNEYKVNFPGGDPKISENGQYSAMLTINVTYPDKSSSKAYAERIRIDPLPHNYGNILSFDISPKMVKKNLKKLGVPVAESDEKTPRELTFFIDRSGTMVGQPLREAVNGTLLLLRSVLGDADSFRIVSFGSRSEYLRLNEKDEFTAADLDQNKSVELEMGRFTANMGETNLREPIEIAISRRTNKKRIFVLISDGLFGRPMQVRGDDVNYGENDFQHTKMLIRQEVARAETGAFRFFAVGVGRNSHQMGLDELTRAGKGSFIHVPQRHRLQSEMLKLGDHFKLNHFELTGIKLTDTRLGNALTVFAGPGVEQTPDIIQRQWQCLGLDTRPEFNHLVQNCCIQNKHQIHQIYDSDRVHYHIPHLPIHLSPKDIQDHVTVKLEVNLQHTIPIDLTEAVIHSDVVNKIRNEDELFPLKSYGYQQSAFLSTFNPPIPEINKYDLHTEFALKTQIMVFKKTSYGWFDMTEEEKRKAIEKKEREEEARLAVRPIGIPEISAQNYDAYFGSGRQHQGFAHQVQVGGVGGRPQGGDYAGGNQGVPGQRRPTFGKPPPAGGASAMRKHRKQNKYGVRYQNTILPKPTYIPEDKNFTPLLLQADRTWIWRSKQQTWEQIRKYLAFEEDIHPPMLVKELFKPDGKFAKKFKFSRENEAQERDDLIVTLFVYAIFEKKCERKRDIWSRYWRNTLATMNSKFGAKEEDVKALKQEILQFIHKKGMLLPERY